MKTATIRPDDFLREDLPLEMFAGWCRERLREQGIEFRPGAAIAPTPSQVLSLMVKPWRVTEDVANGSITIEQGKAPTRSLEPPWA